MRSNGRLLRPVNRRTSRAVGGVSLSVAAGISSLLAGIVLLPFILQEAGAGSYGVWLILSSVAAYLYYSDLGVGSAISHFGARARGGQSGPSIAGLLVAGLTWSGAACLIVAPAYFLFSDWYVGSWGQSVAPDDRTTLIVLSMGLLIPLLLRPFGSALVGAGFLTIDRRNQLIGVAVRVVGTIGACISGAGIIGIALAELAALLVPSILSIASLHRRKIIRLTRSDFSLGTMRLMLGFSYRSFSVNLIGALTVQSGMIVIGLTGTSADVTYYNAAYRIYSSVRQLLTWTVDPFRPALSRLFAKDRTEATPVLMSILLISLGAGATASIALIIATPDLIVLWLGSAVPTDAVSVTAQVLLAGLLLNMIHIPLAPATDAAGKPGRLFWGQTLWLCCTLGASFPLAGEYGILGVALALSIPLLLIEPLMLMLAMPALGIKISSWFHNVAKPVAVITTVPLLPTFAVGLLTQYFGTSYQWFILGCVYGLVCIAAVIIFGGALGFRKSLAKLNIGL